MVPMGAPRARTVPDPVTKSGSAAAVLDFAVGQILRDDTALLQPARLRDQASAELEARVKALQ